MPETWPRGKNKVPDTLHKRQGTGARDLIRRLENGARDRGRVGKAPGMLGAGILAQEVRNRFFV